MQRKKGWDFERDQLATERAQNDAGEMIETRREEYQNRKGKHDQEREERRVRADAKAQNWADGWREKWADGW